MPAHSQGDVVAKPLEGVRVLEVAAWTFVPAAGAILSDLGAEVIKVEPPTGDPQRALKNMLEHGQGGAQPVQRGPKPGQAQHHDRPDQARGPGRRAQDRRRQRRLPHELPARGRAKLGLDVDDLRAANPVDHLRPWDRLGQQGPDAGYRRLRHGRRRGRRRASPSGCSTRSPTTLPRRSRRRSTTCRAGTRSPAPSRWRCSSASARARPPSSTCRC